MLTSAPRRAWTRQHCLRSEPLGDQADDLVAVAAPAEYACMERQENDDCRDEAFKPLQIARRAG